MNKKALLYTEDTENILELAQYLNNADWIILSAGKTGEILRNNNIPCKLIPFLEETNLQFSESLGLFLNILNSRIESTPSFPIEEENNILLVCCNFDVFFTNQEGPFDLQSSERIRKDFCASFLHAAIQNYKNVLPLTDSADYREAIIQIRTDSIREDFRLYLTGKALNLISAYNASKACEILEKNLYSTEKYMNYMMKPYKKVLDLHYGINAQQSSAYYVERLNYGTVNGFKKLQGRELTHSIIVDSAFAWEQITMISTTLKSQSSVNSVNRDGYPFTTMFTPLRGTVFTIIVKAKSVFGAGIDTNTLDSFKKTISYDPDVILRSTLGCSAVIDENAALEIVKYDFKSIIAPGFTEKAREILSENHATRLLIASQAGTETHTALILDGGLIVQSRDTKLFEKWIVTTKVRPSQKLVDELAFGTIIAMSARSYACVTIKNNAVVGISAGFGSRVKSLENACYEAKQTFKFHPTDDNIIADVLVCDTNIELCEPIKELIERGISAIIQTGGGPNDKEFIDYCDAHGVSLIFTGMTHHNY